MQPYAPDFEAEGKRKSKQRTLSQQQSQNLQEANEVFFKEMRSKFKETFTLRFQFCSCITLRMIAS